MNYNNLAQKTNFIAGSNAFKNIPFFLSSVNIPGISLSHPQVAAGTSAFINAPADGVTFNSLSFNVMIDEDFLIYQELMEIINKNVHVEESTFDDFFFDFFIEVNNSKGNKVLKIEFYNCRIASIGDIELDTTSDETEMLLPFELVYDYYTAIQRRIPVLSGDVGNVISYKQPQSTYKDNFETIQHTWQLWGFPLPVIVQDQDAANGSGLATNGSGLLESGTVLNDVLLGTSQDFEVRFRVKQEFATDASTGDYVVFGITEGEGISSTTNGRTGSTISGFTVDGGAKDSSSVKGVYLYDHTSSSDTEIQKNDGFYHEYKIIYTASLNSFNTKLYIDQVLVQDVDRPLSLHDYFYVFIQGKSSTFLQSVDSIAISY